MTQEFTLNRVEIGDCRVILPTLPEETFQCCVTSPPYWGLRDYGVAGQLGAEPTPDAYVANLLTVFREVRRVLREDGTLWLNLGDSYASGGQSAKGGAPSASSTLKGNGHRGGGPKLKALRPIGVKQSSGLKPKDLVGIPWRVAFALQSDGWYLRSDIIWAKGNCMPEAVTDRPTKSHEYLFLLSKQSRYYYDADAIAEPLADANAQRTTDHYDTAARYGADNGGNSGLDGLASRMRSGEHTKRNKRSVWHVNPKPYIGSHFAVMPEALAQPCILAGSKFGDAVLDPFMGSGTVGQVAESLGRRWFGCELNPEYGKLVSERTVQAGLPFLGGAPAERNE